MYISKYKGSEVEDAIGKARTALQEHQSLEGYAKKADLAKVATSGSYNDLSDKPTISSAVTESTVSGWGFTKNTGTYSKPSSGIPKSDLASDVQLTLTQVNDALSGSINYTPVRMVVKAPSTISIRNKVAQRIGVVLYPSYVMNNVLFNKFDGTSLHINPSGSLTVKGLGKSSFYIIPTANTDIWQQVDVTVRQPQIRLTGAGKMRLNNGRIRIV